MSSPLNSMTSYFHQHNTERIARFQMRTTVCMQKCLYNFRFAPTQYIIHIIYYAQRTWFLENE